MAGAAVRAISSLSPIAQDSHDRRCGAPPTVCYDWPAQLHPIWIAQESIMHKRVLALALTLSLLLGIVATPQAISAAPKTPGEVPDTKPPFLNQYFPQTQHAAVNSFLAFWKRTPNALFVLGYPISQPFIEESFTEPGTYYRVQYFERAILEEHPENYGTRYYILGRLLGNQIVKSRAGEAPFQPAADPGDGTFDSATSHTLRNGPAPFRSFWQKNGGLSVFGRPTSEQFQELNQ